MYSYDVVELVLHLRKLDDQALNFEEGIFRWTFFLLSLPSKLESNWNQEQVNNYDTKKKVNIREKTKRLPKRKQNKKIQFFQVQISISSLTIEEFFILFKCLLQFWNFYFFASSQLWNLGQEYSQSFTQVNISNISGFSYILLSSRILLDVLKAIFDDMVETGTLST